VEASIERDFRAVGVWTSRDTESWVPEAYRRIYERELVARLADVHVCFVGDVSPDTALVSERGDLITSLDASQQTDWPPVAALDALVVAGVETPALSAVVRSLERNQGPQPVVILSALSLADLRASGDRDAIGRVVATAREVSVRDAPSLDAVRELRAADDLALVLDPLILLDRLVAPAAVHSRIAYLRAMDGYPTEAVLLVETALSHTHQLARLGRSVKAAIALGHRIKVVAIPAPGESMTGGLRRCVEEALEPVFCAERFLLEDLVATVAASLGVAALSPGLFALASAFRRPVLRCGAETSGSQQLIEKALPGEESLIRDSLDDLLRTPAVPPAANSWRAQIDSHFDRVARILAEPTITRTPRSKAMTSRAAAQLEEAHRIAGRRLADDRLRFAERIEELNATVAGLKAELARRSCVEARLRQEMARAWAPAAHEALSTDLRSMHMPPTVPEANASSAPASGAATSSEVEELRAAVLRFERSRSWRYLAPARAAARVLRRWFTIDR
jgi:hypothetical protein